MLHGLDAEQRAAVTTLASPLAIVAAAGSGKTTVLTRRIAYRSAHGTATPQHVLALTFTREAAAELKRRLRRLDIREPIEAGTFHGVALRLLRDRALAANHAPPHVANDRLRLAREVASELKLQVEPYGALADLDWAKARMVTPDRYEGAIRITRRRTSLPPARFADFAAAYERLKRRRGVVDFDDLLTHTIEALRTDRPWAEGVHWRYRHFFVDEVQDLNPLQHAMLEALRAGRPDLCLVGDPRQAIYGWNGADPTTLARGRGATPGSPWWPSRPTTAARRRWCAPVRLRSQPAGNTTTARAGNPARQRCWCSSTSTRQPRRRPSPATYAGCCITTAVAIWPCSPAPTSS